MSTTIAARKLISSAGTLEYPLLSIEDGFLITVESVSREDYAGLPVTHRFQDGVLVPSFVDVHLHGCAGHDVMEADQQALGIVGKFLAQRGVGAFLPTTVTSPPDEMLRSLSGLAKVIERAETSAVIGAVPLGIHLEGPFLSHAKRGVHADDMLRAPSIPLFEAFWQAAEGRILLMTIAPELSGATDLIAYASARGVRCSLGHSDAAYAEARAGHDAGAVSATHTFNAMRGLDHRDPGVAAFVLDQDALFAEVIADGLHVDPVMVRLFFKAKGAERTLLVTDGISATGMPDGRYKLGGMEVDVIEGRCTSGGRIAGSTLTLDRAIRNFMDFTGVDLHIAVNAASRNPARMIGQELAWGSLEAGRPANVAVLSSANKVVGAFIRGVPVNLTD